MGRQLGLTVPIILMIMSFRYGEFSLAVLCKRWWVPGTLKSRQNEDYRNVNEPNNQYSEIPVSIELIEGK